MEAVRSFASPLTLLLCVIVVVVPCLCDPVDVALNRPVEARVTCGSLAPEPFLSYRYVYTSSTIREQFTQTCWNTSAYPPSAMVDGSRDTWWQSASRTVTIRVLEPSARFDAEIFVDLQQVCILP